MFYCEKCRIKNEWPEGFGRSSYGKCEICGKPAGCYDIPSKYLPIPPHIAAENRKREEAAKIKHDTVLASGKCPHCENH